MFALQRCLRCVRWQRTRHKRGNPLSGLSMALHPPSAGRVPRQAPLPTGRDKVRGGPSWRAAPSRPLTWPWARLTRLPRASLAEPAWRIRGAGRRVRGAGLAHPRSRPGLSAEPAWRIRGAGLAHPRSGLATCPISSLFSSICVNKGGGRCLRCRKDGWALAAARVILALGAATAPMVCHESRNPHPSTGDPVG
jgi:hypothetical protein